MLLNCVCVYFYHVLYWKVLYKGYNCTTNNNVTNYVLCVWWIYCSWRFPSTLFVNLTWEGNQARVSESLCMNIPDSGDNSSSNRWRKKSCLLTMESFKSSTKCTWKKLVWKIWKPYFHKVIHWFNYCFQNPFLECSQTWQKSSNYCFPHNELFPEVFMISDTKLAESIVD